MEQGTQDARGGQHRLRRLLSPKSIAVVGGGVWCRSVVEQAQAFGFSGRIDVVHARGDTVADITAHRQVADLDHIPDAVFLGINRTATLPAVKELSRMGAGGAVCFASGFAEATAEDQSSAEMQAQLVAAAVDMPILGPNCYGFVNALDRALLWPDQHGCKPVARGVAILTQSSNIAINLTMQQRGLPIAYAITCGNMAQTSQAQIARALLEDDRVTAIGLHVEGFGDPAEWHDLAVAAQARDVPLVVLKTGASEQARYATLSHTASLAGSDAGATALLEYIGVPRVSDVPTFLETLMLQHGAGGLTSAAVSSISCSGGEASLSADIAQEFDVTLPALTEAQCSALKDALGPMVSVANPLDYHTYIWGNAEKMAKAWAPMAAPDIGIVLVIVDYPHTDPSAWTCATDAVIALRRNTDVPVALVATIPELLPEPLSERLLAAGVVPLHGLREAFAAIEAAAHNRTAKPAPPLASGPLRRGEMMSEAHAKNALAEFDVPIPAGATAGIAEIAQTTAAMSGPLVLKAQGIAHKSEVGGVKLNLDTGAVAEAAAAIGAKEFLIEEMVSGAVAEVLVGVVRDDAHGFVLTLGVGGTKTELIQDRSSLLLPVTRTDVTCALRKLRYWPVLEGYRGTPPVDLNLLVTAIMAVQEFVIASAHALCELEINPVICTPDRVVAADALIVCGETTQSEGH